jgi:hypothetical protein
VPGRASWPRVRSRLILSFGALPKLLDLLTKCIEKLLNPSPFISGWGGIRLPARGLTNGRLRGKGVRRQAQLLLFRIEVHPGIFPGILEPAEPTQQCCDLIVNFRSKIGPPESFGTGSLTPIRSPT